MIAGWRAASVAYGLAQGRSVELLDYLVGAGEERGCDCEPDRFRRPQIDHKLEYRRLLNRKVKWAASWPLLSQ